MPTFAIVRASTKEPGRLITVARRSPRNSAKYHRKEVARSSIARKPATKHNATTVNNTVLRTDLVIAAPPLPLLSRPNLRPAHSQALRPVRCRYRPPKFQDSGPGQTQASAAALCIYRGAGNLARPTIN